ncbi:unnamed protein product [Chondrus crispus]|uniref:Uncharacterized protein n=1 Tax=Chondrus crispus TaxID=2769 RepID=R7QN69_CHOCR|nr:unnamed protein product [Chondrus crispus]CDF38835.1 unnamed protein product [Chondrus crispus]|eukprot:XP_005718740.1 unnamed protein product [Chondrus crispus]
MARPLAQVITSSHVYHPAWFSTQYSYLCCLKGDPDQSMLCYAGFVGFVLQVCFVPKYMYLSLLSIVPSPQ